MGKAGLEGLNKIPRCMYSIKLYAHIARCDMTNKVNLWLIKTCNELSKMYNQNLIVYTLRYIHTP